MRARILPEMKPVIQCRIIISGMLAVLMHTAIINYSSSKGREPVLYFNGNKCKSYNRLFQSLTGMDNYARAYGNILKLM